MNRPLRALNYRSLLTFFRDRIGLPMLGRLGWDTKQSARQRVLDHLQGLYGGQVQYGLFKGMELGGEVWWSKYDLSTKILGVYEEHVLARIGEFYSASSAPFIDIGAADGYFAVGVAKSLPAAKVFAFEISDRGRSVLQNNAQLNECSSAIAVGDEATYEALANIISMHQSALVLIDIEGDEYQLLDSEMLSLLSSSTVIVELHPRKVADGWHLQQKLMQDAAKFFETEILVRETYNPNMFEELSEFSDEDRLLAFSEGRKAVGLWLILTPKAHSAKDYCNEHNC